MNYIILNGVNSNTITGLLIQELPPISKPLMRTQIDQIDGRDGDIVTKLGYSAYDKEFTVGLHGSFDINQVIAYFATEGTVVFSNEPDKYYRYQTIEQIDFERLVRYRTATVTFHCQPFKYEVDETPIDDAGNTETTGDMVTFESQGTDPVAVTSNIVPYQNLNGYDHPWVGGAGTNLLAKSPISGSQNGLVVSYNENTETYSLTAGTISAYAQLISTESFVVKAGTYYFKKFPSADNIQVYAQLRSTDGTTTYASSDNTVTFASDTTVKARIVGNANTVVPSNFTIKLMLVSGSTAPTTWTPYENICPIYPATGKNLLPPHAVGTTTKHNVTATFRADGTISVSGTGDNSAFDGIFVNEFLLPSGTYVINGQNGVDATNKKLTLQLRNSDANVQIVNLDTASDYTFTLSQTTQVLVNIGLRTGVSVTDAVMSPMIRPAEITSATYVPYKGLETTRTGKNLFNKNNYESVGTYSYIDREGLVKAGTVEKTFCMYLPQGTYSIQKANANGTKRLAVTQFAVKPTVGAIGTNLLYLDANPMKGSFTLSSSSWVAVWFYNGSGADGTLSSCLDTVMLETGSVVSAYEPYQSTQFFNLNYNMWDEVWEVGGINSSGQNYAQNDRIRSKNYISVTPNATYYYYINSTYGLYTWGYDANKTYVGRVPSNGYAVGNNTVTMPSDVHYIRFAVQPDYGTTYNGDIIINYSNPSQVGYGGTLDVDTGLLTVDKAMVTLTGTENWWRQSSANFTYYTSRNDMKKLADYSDYIISDKLKTTINHTSAVKYAVTGYRDSQNSYPTQNWIYIRLDDSVTTADDFKAWLANNNTNVVYPLATPQTYQLTGAEVRALLGVNNIWTDSGTVSVTVPNLITVTNKGNTDAKPIMTITGSGNIGVFLNGNQVFSIALGDTGSITIDAEQMEAYQGGILRNRLVTGDYSNFVLHAGENILSVMGDVSQVEISNYSRWI